MQDALDQVLAAAKITADVHARAIRANVATFQREAASLEFLFADLGQIVHKAADDFAAVLSSRIATHRAAEAAREAKRKADEEARIQAEAQRLADEAVSMAASIRAESRRVEWPKNAAYVRRAMGTFECMAPDWQDDPREVVREAVAEGRRYLAGLLAEAEANQAQQQAQAALQAAATPAPAPAPAHAPVAAAPVQAPPAPAPAAAPAADEPATLKLGLICDRLGLTMTAQFVAETLNVKPARVEGTSRLYTESQFQRICLALASHARAMAVLYEGEPA